MLSNYWETRKAFQLGFILFIFFHVEENEPKEDARVPLNPARRRRDRSARKLTFAQTVPALFSVRSADARRGTKGINSTLSQKNFNHPFGAARSRPLYRNKPATFMDQPIDIINRKMLTDAACVQDQGVQTLRSEAYIMYAAVTKGAAQRRDWAHAASVSGWPCDNRADRVQ